MPALPEQSLTTEIASERMLLLGGRAMYWPARRRLIIADLHLGKGDAFRRAGIAVPQGATQEDLQRLSHLVEATDALALWIVGDFLHGPMSHADWRDEWLQWREQHARLDVAVLVGNHDRALRAEALGLRALGESCFDAPFLFQHIPGGHTAGHVIAGHVHPKVRVPGLPRHWPAFWLQDRVTILPAFSAFTGGYAVKPAAGERIVACVAEEVVALRW